MNLNLSRNVVAAIVVSSLGYFVDVYDLLLFSIVRVQSLKSLGFQGSELTHNGLFLLNMQMFGMLIGGIIWGMLGDKRGRIMVLFGSIFVYSVANIANAFVHSLEWYAFWRLIAGFGLAGELGAGVTLVCELLPSSWRGYGTMIIASVGVLGAVVASNVGALFDWRVSYFIGGILGLLLFVMRVGVLESGLYQALGVTVRKGSFIQLFSKRERVTRYISCVLCGCPVWFVVGILITFAPEFGAAFEMATPPVAGTAVMWCYSGLVVGDLVSGFLSQQIRGRKIVLLYFLLLVGGSVSMYLSLWSPSLFEYYVICFILGFSSGYWAVLVTSASEQFGTNVRATVTTSVPNFIRGSVVPITWTFQSLQPNLGIVDAASAVGYGVIILALLAVYSLRETFDDTLDFVD